MVRVPKVCVGCGKEGTVKEIIYGLPAEDYDRDRYLLGGCIPEDVVAECTHCRWQKIKKKKVFEGVGVNRPLK